MESSGSWGLAKVLGGVGIAFATAFFALTIRFVAEIRSEIASLQTLVEERVKEADKEMTYLFEAVVAHEKSLAENRSDIENIELKISKLLDSHIEVLQGSSGADVGIRIQQLEAQIRELGRAYPYHSPPDR